MKQTFFNKLKRFFTPNEKPKEFKPGIHIRKASHEEDHWVPLSLEDIFIKKPEAEVHCISLSHFKQEVGEHWNKLSEKIQILTESILKHHIGHTGIITQASNDLYLVSLPHLKKEDARKKISQIAIAIGIKLVGAKFKITDENTPLPIGLLSFSLEEIMSSTGKIDQEKIENATKDIPQINSNGIIQETSNKSKSNQNQNLKKEIAKEKDPFQNWEHFHKKKKDPIVEYVPIEKPKKKNYANQWEPIEKKKD